MCSRQIYVLYDDYIEYASETDYYLLRRTDVGFTTSTSTTTIYHKRLLYTSWVSDRLDITWQYSQLQTNAVLVENGGNFQTICLWLIMYRHNIITSYININNNRFNNISISKIGCIWNYRNSFVLIKQNRSYETRVTRNRDLLKNLNCIQVKRVIK